MLDFIVNYAGVIIGAIILLISVWFLPAKIRAYVLTGGLAVLVYRAWQIYTTTGRLQELDAEREQLRRDRDELVKKAEGLEQQQIEIKKERDAIIATVVELKKEKKQLDGNSDELEKNKKNIDKKIDKLLKDHDASAPKWDSLAAAIQKMTEANQLIDQDGILNKDESQKVFEPQEPIKETV